MLECRYMEDTKKISGNVLIMVVISLIVGLVAGYFIGYSNGVAKGELNILEEQKLEQEKALGEIQKEANPFVNLEEKANPFKDTYTNPFAQ